MSKRIDFDAIRKFRSEMKANKVAARKYILAAELDEDEIEYLLDLYDEWSDGLAVKVGERYQHNGNLYEVIQAHTTQSDWAPDTVSALFKKVTPKETESGEEIVPDFVPPTGAHDSYKKGNKVLFEGKVYESLIDNNAYSPTAYPAGWKLVE